MWRNRSLRLTRKLPKTDRSIDYAEWLGRGIQTQFRGAAFQAAHAELDSRITAEYANRIFVLKNGDSEHVRRPSCGDRLGHPLGESKLIARDAEPMGRTL